MILIKRAISLAIKGTPSEEGVFSGLGSVFGNKDSYGDVVMPGAFAKSLDRHKKDGTLPAMLWQHNPSDPIGVYKAMEEVEDGLALEGQYALKTAEGARAYELTKMGALKGLSIGYTIPKGGAFYDEENDILQLKEIDLWEVSVVTFPANHLANITDVRSAIRGGTLPTEREFEAILREAGYSHTIAKACVAKPYREVLRDADKSGKADVESLINSLKSLETTFRS